MAAYKDRYFNSADLELKLHFRDYEGPRDKPPILCLPGLTRNARDFEPVAEAFAGDWRVICMEFRGRGKSEWDPKPERYMPPTYAADVTKFLDEQGIADAVFVGTSLGGIVTMLVGASDGERIAGALINDIAPELHEPGIVRIREYVGQQPIYTDYAEAAEAMHAASGAVYPKWGVAEWERFARRTMKDVPGGVRFDYDPDIAVNVINGADEEPMDAWHLLGGLSEIPVTILRGEISDLFTQEHAERMLSMLPQGKLVTIPDVGHAPTFDEPESIAALAELLARVEALADDPA